MSKKKINGGHLLLISKYNKKSVPYKSPILCIQLIPCDKCGLRFRCGTGDPAEVTNAELKDNKIAWVPELPAR